MRKYLFDLTLRPESSTVNTFLSQHNITVWYTNQDATQEIQYSELVQSEGGQGESTLLSVVDLR